MEMLWDDSLCLSLSHFFSCLLSLSRHLCLFISAGSHVDQAGTKLTIAEDDPGLLIFLPLAPNTEIMDILSLCICLVGFEARSHCMAYPGTQNPPASACPALGIQEGTIHSVPCDLNQQNKKIAKMISKLTSCC